MRVQIPPSALKIQFGSFFIKLLINSIFLLMQDYAILA